MSKGCKLMASRSERLLGSYGYGQVHSGCGAAEITDLREEDVWSMVDDGGIDHEERFSVDEWIPRAVVGSNGGGTGTWGGRRLLMSPPRDNGSDRRVGGLSLAFDEYDGTTTSLPRVVHQFRGQQGHHHMGMATSAPVNVPDWHEILRVDSAESIQESGSDEAAEEGGEDSAEEEWIPPHEYLARSRKSAATSVFEGVGRTLKGRDLSRVRDAVWSQTGFDG